MADAGCQQEPFVAAQQHQRPGQGAAATAVAGSPSAELIVPNSGHCILHFDADSFYAQVEEVRLAWIRHHWER